MLARSGRSSGLMIPCDSADNQKDALHGRRDAVWAAELNTEGYWVGRSPTRFYHGFVSVARKERRLFFASYYRGEL